MVEGSIEDRLPVVVSMARRISKRPADATIADDKHQNICANDSTEPTIIKSVLETMRQIIQHCPQTLICKMTHIKRLAPEV
jgi:hypothetical protein